MVESKSFYPRSITSTAQRNNISQWVSWTPPNSRECHSTVSSLNGAISPQLIIRFDPAYQGNQLPSNAIIRGIKIYFNRAAEEASATNYVQDGEILLKVSSYDPVSKTPSTTKWDTYIGGSDSGNQIIYGGSSDTWGLGSSLLTGDHFNNGFELRVSAKITCDRTNYSAYAFGEIIPSQAYTTSAVVYYEEIEAYVVTRDPADFSGGDAITETTATSGGKDIPDEIDDIDEKGIQWVNNSTGDSFTDKVSSTSSGDYRIKMTGLSSGTNYKVRAYIIVDGTTIYGDWIYFDTIGTSNRPLVSTLAAINITTNAAEGGNRILAANGTIRQRGIAWSTSSDVSPTNYEGIYTENTSFEGDEYFPMLNLTPGQTYYFVAFATNDDGMGTGDVLWFTTTAGLSVVTRDPDDPSEGLIISTGYAESGGKNISPSVPLTRRGIVWTTRSSTPPVLGLDSYTEVQQAPPQNPSDYKLTMNFLSAGTTYYVRAFVQSSTLGLAYGNTISFTTLPVSSVPTLSTYAADQITQTDARSGGYTITANGNLTEKGICWNTTGNPTIADNHNSMSTSSADNFTMAVDGLTCNNTYYVRAYAINQYGVGYGNQISFTTLACGTQPSVNTIDATNVGASSATVGGDSINLNGNTKILGSWTGVRYWNVLTPTNYSDASPSFMFGEESFFVGLSGLSGNVDYAYKAFIRTYEFGYTFGQVKYFRTDAPLVPGINTADPEDVKDVSARLGASSISMNGYTLTRKGIWYDSYGQGGKRYVYEDTNDPSPFLFDVTGLTPNKFYRFAAYLYTNIPGLIAEGSIKYFTTLKFPPTSIVKQWNGSTWQIVPVKIWNGSTWQDIAAKYWNGSIWASS